jgi:hypothetical protein
MWKQQMNMANKMLKTALANIDNIDTSTLSEEQRKFFMDKIAQVKRNAKNISFDKNGNNDDILKQNNKVLEEIINFTKTSK